MLFEIDNIIDLNIYLNMSKIKCLADIESMQKRQLYYKYYLILASLIFNIHCRFRTECQNK